MTVDQLRQRFLNFFKKKGHVVVESDSLIPQHDPTLLFTGAGMNQFKDQFMGRNITYKRAVTCQKCLRTADLEKVGKTAGHHTFFEMLGNFSFGDYFKKDAIIWAWEFLTRDLRIPKDRLWASVYREDTEAYDIWKDLIKIPENRIVKLGDKENFWPSEVKKNGPNGPCGPCSEIFYDWGTDIGCGKEACDPSCDCGRFVEIWNLVFTQFERKDGGKLEPLPTKNIDTGMGLERIAAVVQKKKTNFGIDSFSQIIKAITRELNVRYGHDREADSHINAIADHIRAASFAIYDGARPSNEGRGFVIRKLIRKASQRARALGIREPFIYKIIPAVGNAMKHAYPQLARNREDMAGVVLTEEVNLEEILNTILPHVEEEILALKMSKESVLSGEIIFRFYDEKGVPLDLMEERAKEHGLGFDRDGFRKLLEQQKARSRDKSKVADSIFVEKLSDSHLKTEFLDNKDNARAKVLAILKKKNGSAEQVKSAGPGDEIHIALDKTPFYGQSGGQAGDKGELVNKGLKVSISDAKKYEDTIDHIGKVVEGRLKINDTVEARIDAKRRGNIKKNHTATHLLHSALRKVLGGHVRQYGSLVEEDRLRFDFTHPSKMTEDQISRVEDLVNGYIADDMQVKTTLMNLADAKKAGAAALFGEKYKDKVTVRTIGDVSKELCGGTHCASIGEIGAFKIASEGSIASGVRRIEAFTGRGLYEWLRQDVAAIIARYKDSLRLVKEASSANKQTIDKIEDYLRPMLFNSERLVKKDIDSFQMQDARSWTKELKPAFIRTIENLSKELKKAGKLAKSEKLGELKADIETLIKSARNIKGMRVISSEIDGAGMDLLRGLLDDIKSKIGSGIILLGSKAPSRANLACGVTKDLVKNGFDASVIIKKIAGTIGGSGGGRPDMAQAGGKDPAGLKKALDSIYKIVEEVN